MSNLEDLPEGLLAEIARLVSSYDDFEAIHEVNHHWRSSLRGLCYSCTTPQAPWLMLAAEDDTKDGEVEERGFYSLTNSRMRRVKLPERLRRRRCLSSRGWLLTVSRYLSLSLVNPFSKHVIHLPHPPDKNPKYEDEWRFYVEKFALSLSSSKDEKDYTVVTIYGDRSDLAFWRPGDLTWTKIGFEFASHVIYAGGVFFFTDILFQVSICGITGMQPAIWDEALGKRSYTTKFRILADMNASLKRCSYKIYVVHSQRNLLVVNRTIDKVHHTTKVTVAHLAIRTKEITLTKDLGNRSLLLGSNESISLEGVKGCMPNCIYFTDDAWDFWPSHDKGGKGGQNMGVYYLTDDKFVPHYRGESSLSRLTPPLWVECRA